MVKTMKLLKKLKPKTLILVGVIFLAVIVLLIARGCSGSKTGDEDKGAMIQMYLTGFPNNLDPTAVSYGSADNAKIFGLLYEGLFTIDENGKLQKALADEWEYFVDARDNTLKLEIKIGNSKWSDGIPVDADDFVYAYQRLLSPSFDNPAAALLYPVKNARAAKEGLCSINDVGLYAIKDNVLQIAFEKDFTNVQYFMRRLASPVLVPLREDNASKFDDPDNIDYLWDASATMAFPLTNGAFKYRKFTADTVEFERNIHYANVSANEDNAVDMVVKPYQLITVYKEGKTDLSTPDSHLEAYQAGENFYLNLSGAENETLAKVGKMHETAIPSVYTYFFDTTNELFADARVRKALSVALDRNEIARLTGRSVKPAAGLVPYGAEETVQKTDFRKGHDLIAPTGDTEAAKALLKEAGVRTGNIAIDYNKERPYEEAVASYVAGVWKELGFKVKTNGRNGKFIYGIASGATEFAANDAARVVGMDFQCVTPDAFGMLVSFSTVYGGGTIDLTVDEVTYADRHLTGYASEEYDAIADKFVNALNDADRAAALHEAEAFLVEEAPVAPLFCNVDLYVSRDLSGIKHDKFGAFNFTKVSQKNYKKYLPEETEHVELEKADDETESEEAEGEDVSDTEALAEAMLAD